MQDDLHQGRNVLSDRAAATTNVLTARISVPAMKSEHVLGREARLVAAVDAEPVSHNEDPYCCRVIRAFTS
jgi:hypothetical protein